MKAWFVKLSTAATVLAFCVIILGAFVRLTDAGLGCPDWPGCYGQVIPPQSAEALSQAEQAFPGATVETQKAWHEMIHRYLASALGLLILAMAWIAWKNREDPSQPVALPMFLVLLVCFQGALGMWTVTMLLRPAIVTMHLLMGMATFATLAWTTLSARRTGDSLSFVAVYGSKLRTWALVGLFVLFGQIALGGWTSTNYAALNCPDFPTCQGEWVPEMDFENAFDIVGEANVNYEGGLLDHPARMAIHYTHRVGALITFAFLLFLVLVARRAGDPAVRGAGYMVLAMLLVQVGLGIANVELSLPLMLAVAHNGGAALLLFSLVLLNHRLQRKIAAGM